MDNCRNCIYIPSIDAKDLYLSNNSLDEDKNKIGYSLKTKTGEINYNRFINSLDFSLDSEKLREFQKEVYKNKNDFSFIHGKKEYSDKIINVTFKYSLKDFNKVKKDTFVKDGYSYEDLEFNGPFALDEFHEIIGLLTNLPVEENSTPLPSGFAYEYDKDGKVVIIQKTIKNNVTRFGLRQYLYVNGFNCNGHHYVRFKRTSGSARVGKCLFIEESLYPLIHKWEMCGLDIKVGDPVDLAALESYISLPTSSAIDILHIDPKSILIIPDYTSHFQEDSVIVSMNDKNRIQVEEGIADVGNSIFDGQSLIDVSVMGEYDVYGMVLLRNRFFKSCCFNTNIQKWFKDNEITDISQLHPESITFAKRIEDIKLITTPNSIKYVKFAPIEQWLKNIDSTFSVVKHEKKTHFFEGNMVQAHYQLLNTLHLSPEEVHELLEPGLDYVRKLNSNVDVLKYNVKCQMESDDNATNVMKDKNDICYTMLTYSDKFPQTKYYAQFKKELTASYIKNMKKGHILINGNYSVLFGNPYEMLLQTIGEFDGTTTLPIGHIHTTRYPYGIKILGCRSPHISTSNVLVSTNYRHDLIDKYFNLTNEIVCINSIGENILERLSGADFDSDQIIISDNKIIINAALKNYGIFKVPKNNVVSNKTKRYYTNEQKCDLDFKTSDNKIGEIVNLSQELNTLMWDIINKSRMELKDAYKFVKEIYHDICALNVLSCIEIDKAKKEFAVSATTEIKEIRDKWIQKTHDNKTVKPAFLGYIASTKNYKDTKKKAYIYHKTSMDYLIKELTAFRVPRKNIDYIKFSDCFDYEDFNINSVNKIQLKKITTQCENTISAINAVWSKNYYSYAEKFELNEMYKENLLMTFKKMKINNDTLLYLIKMTDDKKYSRIANLIHFLLFENRNEQIIEMMIGMRNNLTKLELSEDGTSDIELYGLPYKKVYLEETYD